MNTKKLKVSCMLLLFLAVNLAYIMPVKATATKTFTFNVIEDAYVHQYDPDTNYGTGTDLVVASYTGGAERTFLKFKLNHTLFAATVKSAILKLYCYQTPNQGDSATQIIAQVVTGSWSETAITWNNQPSVADANVSVTEPSATGWYSINVTSIFSWNETVSFRLRYDDETEDSYSRFYARENGSNTPILEITIEYEAVWTLSGVYYENGLFYGSENVTVNFESATSKIITVNGTETFYLPAVPLYFSWDAGSGYYRQLYPRSNSTTYIFIPEATFSHYTVQIRDYAGIVDSNSYLEVYRMINNTLHLVERRKVKDWDYEVPFMLVQGASYLLVLNLTNGEYRFGWLLANGTTTVTKYVKTLQFPGVTTLPYRYVRCSASRSEDMQTITVNYQDLQGQTVNVTLYITYTNGTTAYYDSSTAQSVQFTWNNAENYTDYIVYLNINRTSGFLTWKKSLPHIITPENPFDLSILGTFPIPATSVFPFFVIITVFALFSTLTVGVGMLMGVLTAGLLRYLGWFTLTGSYQNDITILSVAGSLALIYALVEGRRRR